MITSENYEEYFLLYVDNELSVTERTAVEKFVADNPHLHEEWISLLQCRVHPDGHEMFHDKEILLQQDLLSYIDGELDEEGNRAVQEFVGRYPSKAIELQQLLLTVSEPDLSITFPDKESLYRTDRNRRIILLPWVRAGIAAAVIGLVALLLLTTRHTSEPSAPSGIASTKKKLAPPVTPAAPSPLHSSGNDDHTNASAAATTTAAIATTTTAATTARAGTTTAAATTGTMVAARRTTATRTPVHTPGKGDDTVLSPETTASHPSETALVAEIKPEVAEKPVVRPATPVVAVNIPKEQSSFATQALMEEAQADETKEMIASAPAGKNKLRGIFRRVSRAFGKTADRDSDGQKEVLISAFQVALK